MIARCSCGAPATHKVVIELAPVGVTVPATREPGKGGDVRWGYFSAQHLATLAQMKREYAKAGLAVVAYLILELID